ncbi:hypothetical protein [Sideroxydans sp. CL21]|uniref:hypothetical protein n=1 Tax=Sideroxydans sp. CL21 TaxID=2600596 RepID=UPI0012A89695|nr:hypothetical protein [Sideroxydans sp. CL21]VVC82741.1 hypothetical protein [Sideroxydans sp. CL21]
MEKMTNGFTTELRRMEFENHGVCVACGYKFKKGDTANLGYDNSDAPLYVCDKCTRLLKEPTIKRYYSPRPYDVPTPQCKLWRYMDFTKYVSLLSSRGLYFTRTDCFEDTFEGAKGLRKNKEKWDAHYFDFFCSAIKNPPEGNKCELSEKEVEQLANKLLSDLESGGEAHKKRVFVSCWHESEHESEAMWRLYSSFLANAVAVRTTYKSLYSALGRDPSISIGRVRYIDLKKEYAGVNDAFWRKRKSFEHEREVRALIMDFECKDMGKVVPCNLDVLIEEVFVSPKAPDWLIGLVNDVNEKYGIKVKVSTSELSEVPFFKELLGAKIFRDRPLFLIEEFLLLEQ